MKVKKLLKKVRGTSRDFVEIVDGNGKCRLYTKNTANELFGDMKVSMVESDIYRCSTIVCIAVQGRVDEC